MAHWWRRDELLALLQAWEQTLAPPRDREDLSPDELTALCNRFLALRPRDAPAVAPQEVHSQHQRLVRTFLFVRAFNDESRRSSRPTWFQLPPQTQEELRNINGRLGDLAAIAEDEFDHLRRICEEVPTPLPTVSMGLTLQPTASPPPPPPPPMPVDEMKAAAEALAGLPMFRPNPDAPPSMSPLPSSPKRGKDDSGSESTGFDSESEIDDIRSARKDSDVDYVPPKGKGKAKNANKWAKRDERCLLNAWHEVVTNLARTEPPGAFASRNEALRLNSLVHERFAELYKGRTPRTNQSTGAKKHALMSAFKFLRELLRELASLSNRPNWFGMTPDERMEVQKLHGHHQENACTIEKDMYQQLAEIDRATRIITTPDDNPMQINSRQANSAAIGDMRKRWSGVTTPRGAGSKRYASSDSSEDDESSDGGRQRNGPPKGGRISPAGGKKSKRATPSNRKGAVRRTSRDLVHANGVATDGRNPKRRRSAFSDPVWVTRLLDTQTQRFESLLAEFREERRQERQHNVEIIVEALKLRSATAQKSDQPSPFVEGLVEKQRQHMLSLFNQLQDERAQEREQARSLLRELSGSVVVSSLDSEEKE